MSMIPFYNLLIYILFIYFAKAFQLQMCIYFEVFLQLETKSSRKICSTSLTKFYFIKYGLDYMLL